MENVEDAAKEATGKGRENGNGSGRGKLFCKKKDNCGISIPRVRCFHHPTLPSSSPLSDDNGEWNGNDKLRVPAESIFEEQFEIHALVFVDKLGPTYFY